MPLRKRWSLLLMMEKKLFLVVPVVLVLMFGGVFLLWKSVLSPVNSKDTTQYNFLITKGQGVGAIALKLKKQGLIKDELVFRLYTKFTNTDKSIVPGEYKLSPNLSLEKLVSTLLKGPDLLWVTIPEGLRREEVLSKFIKVLGIMPENQDKFILDFLLVTKNSEGMLFPETYLFPREVSASKIASTMKNTFDSKFTDEMKVEAVKKSMSVNEVLSLAAIIERETKTIEERPIVAGILLNRLEIGMPLQTDATLQYIYANQRCKPNQLDCDWWTAPTALQKQIRSEYNTYLYNGIPPAPIASPGIASIKAVLYPEESDYLYYIHDGDGKIRYGRDLGEHNANIQKYLR